MYPDSVRSAVMANRWVAERFLAGCNGIEEQGSPMVKEFKATIASARAFLRGASVLMVVRRLACPARISKLTLRPGESAMTSGDRMLIRNGLKWSVGNDVLRLPIDKHAVRAKADRVLRTDVDHGVIFLAS